MQARAILATVSYPDAPGVRLCRTPLNFSGAEVRVRSNPPQLGEHNREVLGAMRGLGADRIEQLTRAGILVAESSASS